MSGFPSKAWRPPHAYVPGVSDRHPEHLFLALLNEVPKADFPDLHVSPVWYFVQVFLNEGFYWEAHELLEAFWMRCPPNSVQSYLIKALIQSANAALKNKMGRLHAEARLRAESRRHWQEAFLSGSPTILGYGPKDFENLP